MNSKSKLQFCRRSWIMSKKTIKRAKKLLKNLRKNWKTLKKQLRKGLHNRKPNKNHQAQRGQEQTSGSVQTIWKTSKQKVLWRANFSQGFKTQISKIWEMECHRTAEAVSRDQVIQLRLCSQLKLLKICLSTSLTTCRRTVCVFGAKTCWSD